MLEDKLLIWKFNRGNADALRGIYEKYKHELVTLAAALLHDRSAAEDVVHEVFVGFLGSRGRFRLTGKLKSYLATCVANKARNHNKASLLRQSSNIDDAALVATDEASVQQCAIFGEENAGLARALNQLPYEQREAVLLHVRSSMKFKAIADAQGVSINTAQGRYRYGIKKLRSLLNGEFEK